MKNLNRKDIEQLLEIDAPVLKDKEIYIYGGGNTAQLFQEGLNREFFFNQIKGYCNSNPEKWGIEIFGKPCIDPSNLRENILVLICA